MSNASLDAFLPPQVCFPRHIRSLLATHPCRSGQQWYSFGVSFLTKKLFVVIAFAVNQSKSFYSFDLDSRDLFLILSNLHQAKVASQTWATGLKPLPSKSPSTVTRDESQTTRTLEMLLILSCPICDQVTQHSSKHNHLYLKGHRFAKNFWTWALTLLTRKFGFFCPVLSEAFVVWMSWTFFAEKGATQFQLLLTCVNLLRNE